MLARTPPETAKERLDRVMAECAGRLTAKGSPVPNVPLAPQNPYIHRGKISDPVKAAQWLLDQQRANRAKILEFPGTTEDQKIGDGSNRL